MSDDQIIYLDVIRIERNIPRKCICKGHRNFTVDTKNREVTCGCGTVIDAFEAILETAKNAERLNEIQEQMQKQRDLWKKQKPHSVIFKNLEKSYRKGVMLPHCPKCDQMFEYEDIKGHSNAEFYKRMKERGKL